MSNPWAAYQPTGAVGNAAGSSCPPGDVREDRLAEHLGGPDVGVGPDVDLAGVAEERGTVLTADLARTKWILVLAIARRQSQTEAGTGEAGIRGQHDLAIAYCARHGDTPANSNP